MIHFHACVQARIIDRTIPTLGCGHVSSARWSRDFCHAATRVVFPSDFPGKTRGLSCTSLPSPSSQVPALGAFTGLRGSYIYPISLLRMDLSESRCPSSSGTMNMVEFPLTRTTNCYSSSLLIVTTAHTTLTLSRRPLRPEPRFPRTRLTARAQFVQLATSAWPLTTVLSDIPSIGQRQRFQRR